MEIRQLDLTHFAVPSASEPGTTRVVTVSPSTGALSCDCPAGQQYRTRDGVLVPARQLCRHRKAVLAHLATFTAPAVQPAVSNPAMCKHGRPIIDGSEFAHDCEPCEKALFDI